MSELTEKEVLELMVDGWVLRQTKHDGGWFSRLIGKKLGEQKEVSNAVIDKLRLKGKVVAPPFVNNTRVISLKGSWA